MLKYSVEQLASIIALPLIIVLLTWNVVIFYKNRLKWAAYDIVIVTVLVLSILRNITVLIYVLLLIIADRDFDSDYCGIVTWLFNSIHTFQASSLTSIAVIGLFSVKLHRKNQSLRTFLTPTHIIYHLFCLTTLCACVGVAAILAQKENSPTPTPCAFLPFELDIKFNVFIIVLHVFLASISLISFLIICFTYYKIKQDGFDYIKKSNSDLSQLSNNFHGINGNVNDNRSFYDTYTINHSKDTWTNTHQFSNSEVLSNHSTTVSSTNSRRPCLIKHPRDEDEEAVEVRRTGLETMHPVLIVCYLFYHLPVIVSRFLFFCATLYMKLFQWGLRNFRFPATFRNSFHIKPSIVLENLLLKEEELKKKSLKSVCRKCGLISCKGTLYTFVPFHTVRDLIEECFYCETGAILTVSRRIFSNFFKVHK